jgi:hypothetical protein
MATIEELQKKIDELENTVKTLIKFMEDKKERQISMPLDVISKSVIRENIPVYKSKTAGSVSVGGYITCELNGLEIKLLYK